MYTTVKKSLVFLILTLCFQLKCLADENYRILISNDDGIHSRGIATLAVALRDIGEVVIVAPLTNRSGASHSITSLSKKLRIEAIYKEGSLFGYAVHGSPADAVGAGIYLFGKERKFDLVVSGINYGTNVGTGSHYSGTVGAAMEGAANNIPAIAVSQAANRGKDYDYAAGVAAQIVRKVLKEGITPGTALNVNVPGKPVRGVVFAPMGDVHLQIAEVQHLEDVVGAPYYSVKLGPREVTDKKSDTFAYLEGYVTVAPIHMDWTAYDVLARIKKWKLEDVSEE